MEGANIFSEVGDISVNDVITGLFDGYEYCYDCEATGKGDDEGTKYENEPLTAYEHLKKLIDNIGHGLVKNVRIYTKADYLNKRILKSVLEEVNGSTDRTAESNRIIVDRVLKLTKYGYTHTYIIDYLKDKIKNPDPKISEYWKLTKEIYLKHRDKVTKELKNT